MKKLIKTEVSRLAEAYAKFDAEAYAKFDLMSEVKRERRAAIAPKVQERALKALEDVEKLFWKVSASISNVELSWSQNGKLNMTFYGVPNSMLFSDTYATKYLKRELHEATRATLSFLWVWPDYDTDRKYKIKIELLFAPK